MVIVEVIPEIRSPEYYCDVLNLHPYRSAISFTWSAYGEGIVSFVLSFNLYDYMRYC